MILEHVKLMELVCFDDDYDTIQSVEILNLHWQSLVSLCYLLPITIAVA